MTTDEEHRIASPDIATHLYACKSDDVLNASLNTASEQRLTSVGNSESNAVQ